MKLVRKPGRVVRRSASLRLIEITVGLIALDLAAAVLPSLGDFIPVDSRVRVAGAAVSGTLAWVARLVLQPKMSGGDDDGK